MGLNPPRTQSACRSCGARVVWVHFNGARGQLTNAPLDAAPHPDGTIAVENGLAWVIRSDFPYEGPRYRSHFATCPQAAWWRGKRRTAGAR